MFFELLNKEKSINKQRHNNNNMNLNENQDDDNEITPEQALDLALQKLSDEVRNMTIIIVWPKEFFLTCTTEQSLSKENFISQEDGGDNGQYVEPTLVVIADPHTPLSAPSNRSQVNATTISQVTFVSLIKKIFVRATYQYVVW